MSGPRSRAHSARFPRRDPAPTVAPPSGLGGRRRPASSASRAPVPPRRLGHLLAASGPFGTAALGLLAGWRPLIVFWACALSALAAGGAVLHRLGPPPDTRAEPHARGPIPVRAPPDASAPAPPVVPPPVMPLSVAPPSVAPPSVAPPPEAGATTAEAPPGRPAPDARAVGGIAREGGGADAADRAGGPPEVRPLLVLHPPKSDAGKPAVQQLAARVGIDDDRVVTEPVAETPARAIIRFYVAADHALARRLGRELEQLGYAWQIENFSARPPPGRQAVEVWLPKR